jgi:hypothetical protein
VPAEYSRQGTPVKAKIAWVEAVPEQEPEGVSDDELQLCLAREVIPLVRALSMEPGAEPQMQRLGVRYRVRATGSRESR